MFWDEHGKQNNNKKHMQTQGEHAKATKKVQPVDQCNINVFLLLRDMFFTFYNTGAAGAQAFTFRKIR